MRRLITLFAVLLLIIFVGPAHAVFIHNTFSSTNQYNRSTGWNLVSPNSFAMGFDALTTDHTLKTIEFAAGYSFSSDSGLILDVDIMSSDASNRPNAILESFVFTSLQRFYYEQASYPIISATSSSNPVLSANSRYWLAISPRQSTGRGAWNQSSPSVGGWRAYLASPTSSWSVSYTGSQGAFKITGDPVSVIPEPTTMLLLSSGLIGLAGFRRKFKKS